MKELIGVWKLLFINSTVSTRPANSASQKTTLSGRIMFTADGYMNALIRSPDTGRHLPNNVAWSFATDAQIGSIARPVTSYCGLYTVRNESGQLYTHTKLDVSLDPSWMDAEQVRHASFSEQDGKSIMTLIPVEVSWISLALWRGFCLLWIEWYFIQYDVSMGEAGPSNFNYGLKRGLLFGHSKRVGFGLT